MYEWLKSARYRRGYTQEDVASRIGISRCYYTQLENQFQGRKPSPRVAKRIGQVLNVDWTMFFDDLESAG